MPRSRRRARRGFWGLLDRLIEFVLDKPLAWLPPIAITLSLTVVIAISKSSPVPDPRLFPRPDSLFPPGDGPGGGPWDTVQVDTTDREGRAIGITLGMLNENYRWLLGSTKFVGISGQDSIPIAEALGSLRREVESPVVVLGMASHENAAEHPDQENGRAQTRADELAEFAHRHFVRSPEIYKVNLGAYSPEEPTTSTSAVERRVVVMQITCRDEGVDLQTGIRNALIKAAERRETSVSGLSYTNFSPDSFRVITAATGVQRSGVPPRCHRSVATD